MRPERQGAFGCCGAAELGLSAQGTSRNERDPRTEIVRLHPIRFQELDKFLRSRLVQFHDLKLEKSSPKRVLKH